MGNFETISYRVVQIFKLHLQNLALCYHCVRTYRTVSREAQNNLLVRNKKGKNHSLPKRREKGERSQIRRNCANYKYKLFHSLALVIYSF